MKTLMYILILALTFSLSSCITIFQGKRSEITLTGNLDEPLNVATGDDNFYSLTLPAKIKVRKKTKNLFVYAPGYEMQNIELKRKFNALYLLNYFGTVGFVVDACNGVTKRIVNKNIDITLNPVPNADDGYMDMAEYFLAKGEKYRARDIVRKALDINPTSDRANKLWNEIKPRTYVVENTRNYEQPSSVSHSNVARTTANSEPEEDFWSLLGKALDSAVELNNSIKGGSNTNSTVSQSLGNSSSYEMNDNYQSNYMNEGNDSRNRTFYEQRYKKWEEIAIRHFNSLTAGGYKYGEKQNGKTTVKGGGTSNSASMSGTSQAKKALIKAQLEMKNIRREAAANNVIIKASEYETVTVDWNGAKGYVPNQY